MLGNQVYGQMIQAKLRINKPGDIYEQKAERVPTMRTYSLFVVGVRRTARETELFSFNYQQKTLTI